MLTLYDHVETHFTDVINISDDMASYKAAKQLFYSSAYILLPRHLRFKLVKYIIQVMVHLEKPYETLPAVEKVKKPYHQRRYNCREYLEMLKSIIEQDGKDLK